MIGIDGCKSGWCVAHGEIDSVQIVLIHQIEEVKDLLVRNATALIDMPIGLPDRDHPRSVEMHARRVATHSSSSIFQTPCRKAVYASDYEEALRYHRDYIGKGISIQSWHICPKIKEVDTFLRGHPTFVNILKEAHPEVCFHFLQESHEKLPSKKIKEGAIVRLEILRTWMPSIEETFAKARSTYKKKDVQDDDILDALCLWLVSWLGKRYGLSTVTDSKNDAFGIPMNMHFVNPHEKVVV